MKKNTPNPLCDHLHEDDGAPIRERERGAKDYGRGKARARFRKRAQLLVQAERSVLETLASELEDLELLDLTVHSVDPHPDSDHFQVTLYPNLPADAVDFPSLQARLDAFAPTARAHLARDISRKRTPFVSFLLLPREAILPNT